MPALPGGSERLQEEQHMGFIFAELILSNADDMAAVRQGFKQPEEIRSLLVTALVDTGAYTLALPEQIVDQLDLPHIEFREFNLANGAKEKMSVVGPVVIRFKNRQTV